MKIYAENSGEMKPINFASAVIDLFNEDPAIKHRINAREDIKEIALHLLTWYSNTSKEAEEDEE